MTITRLPIAILLACTLFATPALAMEHTIGFGLGSFPDYEGSEDQQALPLLMLKGDYDSGRSFSLQGTNLKVNAVPSRTYNFGPVLNYRMGRDDVDNDRVDAMKDIDGALELGLYGSVDINNWLLGLEFLGDVSGEHEGLLTQVSAGYRWKASNDLTITPRIFSTYADDDYMDTYFGVDAADAARSGLPYYEAEGGFKDVGLNLVVNYTPWEHWGIMGLLSYSTLLNDANDSPLVDDVGDDKQMSFGLMGTYRWGK